MHSFLQDLRYAARGLVKTPGFTALAAFTLALGIGANTAIFSVVNGVVLQPLPYERPDEIVRVWPERRFSKEMLVAFEEATSFEAISGYFGATFALTGAGEPEQLRALVVAPGHFAVMGTRPTLGRAFETRDRQPGAEPVVVLSHDLWQRRFAADPDVVGRTLALDGLGLGSRTVVGVLPEGHVPVAGEAQLWVPATFDPSNPDDYRDMLSFRALARLAPGVTEAQAQAEVATLARRLRDDNPTYHSEEAVRSAGLLRLHSALTGNVQPMLWVLLGAVGFVLLIGCSNIVNMLLARAGGRRRELAVRAALGAERSRLVRQLLTESALLGVLGGGLGLLSAVWLESFLLRSLPANVPRVGEIGVGWRELVFAAGLSLLTAWVSGLVPALRATHGGLRGSLRDGGLRSSAGLQRRRANQGLVAAEIALAVVLVAGAGLMLKSLWHLHLVDPGFAAEDVFTLRLSPSEARYDEPHELSAYYRQVLERVEALPGVDSAGAINYLPMTPASVRMGLSTAEQPSSEDAPARLVSVRAITPGYFRTLAISRVRGRDVSEADRVGAGEVGWINQTLAGQLWPAEDPVGKQVLWEDGSPWFTVAGVVGDVRQHRLDVATYPEVYRPLAQAFDERAGSMYLTVRTAAEATQIAPALRQAVWAVDGTVPISNLRSMPDVIETSLAGSRFFASLLTAFGALALTLGAVGVYGVAAYTVSQRTREIGVRMALGARREAVLRSVMARELTPVAIGVALGLAAAVGATRVLASSLYGVSTGDPATLGTVTLVLVAVAATASYWPARRAAAVDPVEALRGG